MFLTQSSNLSQETSRNSFDFEDNITYTEEEFPSDIVFPHSLNVFLRKKIQEIASENGCLQKSLHDAEEKLENLLQSPSISENSFPSETENKYIILEKNKHLNLKKQFSRKNDKIKILNEKLLQATNEILVLKNVNLSLKQEVTKAQKGSSYRKIIIDEDLRNLEKKRKQHIENLMTELKQSKINLDNVKRKLDVSKARIKVLENELNNSRKNIMLLNEKKNYNDQLIETLNNELKCTKIQLLNSEVDIQNQKSKLEREKDVMKNELESLQIQNGQLRRKLEELKT